MAANGISTLPTKEARKLAKIALATAKRQAVGTIGYRVLNYYVGTVSPTPGRPWSASATGNFIVTENNMNIVTEDDKNIILE